MGIYFTFHFNRLHTSSRFMPVRMVEIRPSNAAAQDFRTEFRPLSHRIIGFSNQIKALQSNEFRPTSICLHLM